MKTKTPIPPCPCGGEARLKQSGTGLTVCIECPKCGKHTDYHCLPPGALAEWGRKIKT